MIAQHARAASAICQRTSYVLRDHLAVANTLRHA